VRAGSVLLQGATNEHEETLQDAAQQRPRARGAARRSSSSSSSTCCTENAVLFAQLAGGLALLAHFKRRGPPLSAAASAQALGLEGSSVRAGQGAREAPLGRLGGVCGRCT